MLIENNLITVRPEPSVFQAPERFYTKCRYILTYQNIRNKKLFIINSYKMIVSPKVHPPIPIDVNQQKFLRMIPKAKDLKFIFLLLKLRAFSRKYLKRLKSRLMGEQAYHPHINKKFQYLVPCIFQEYFSPVENDLPELTWKLLLHRCPL